MRTSSPRPGPAGVGSGKADGNPAEVEIRNLGWRARPTGCPWLGDHRFSFRPAHRSPGNRPGRKARMGGMVGQSQPVAGEPALVKGSHLSRAQPTPSLPGEEALQVVAESQREGDGEVGDSGLPGPSVEPGVMEPQAEFTGSQGLGGRQVEESGRPLPTGTQLLDSVASGGVYGIGKQDHEAQSCQRDASIHACNSRSGRLPGAPESVGPTSPGEKFGLGGCAVEMIVTRKWGIEARFSRFGVA